VQETILKLIDDRAEKQVEEANKSISSGWRNYRKILNREVAGKATPKDALDLASLMMELPVTKKQIEADLKLLLTGGEVWGHSLAEKEELGPTIDKLHEDIRVLEATVYARKCEVGTFVSRRLELGRRIGNFSTAANQAPHLFAGSEGAKLPVPLAGTVTDLANAYDKNGNGKPAANKKTPQKTKKE